MDTLAVFRSRTEAVRLYNLLYRSGIGCLTVNTPSSLRLGCGLSIAFNSSLSEKVKSIIYANRFTSFIGFFAR